jgi:U3 small nucleolar RNA-associated protein 11
MRTRLDQQKRQHRERAQPANRQRLGLLEKHKDYVKRAKDYHSKEDRIRKLRQKAAERNKDEFYFGMISSKTKNGVHIQDRGNEAMPVDVVKLLKTQDVGYVRTLVSAEEKVCCLQPLWRAAIVCGQISDAAISRCCSSYSD